MSAHRPSSLCFRGASDKGGGPLHAPLPSCPIGAPARAPTGLMTGPDRPVLASLPATPPLNDA